MLPFHVLCNCVTFYFAQIILSIHTISQLFPHDHAFFWFTPQKRIRTLWIFYIGRFNFIMYFVIIVNIIKFKSIFIYFIKLR